MLHHLPFPQRGKVARRAGWGDFLYGRVGGLPVYRLHRVTDTMNCVRLPDALGQDWSSGCLPPGKSARANASDGTFSGRRPELLSVFGSRAPPWSLWVGRESRGPREGESKHPPWPSGPAELPHKKKSARFRRRSHPASRPLFANCIIFVKKNISAGRQGQYVYFTSSQFPIPNRANSSLVIS